MLFRPSRLRRALVVLSCLLGLALAASCRVEPDGGEASQEVPALAARFRGGLPFEAEGDGFVARVEPGPSALAHPYRLHLPSQADHPVRLVIDGAPVAIHRPGAHPSPAMTTPEGVRYHDVWPGVDSLWLRFSSLVEELLVLRRAATIEYALALPPEVTLEAGEGPTARLMRNGRVLMHIVATEAWDARGDAVPVRLEVEGTRLRLSVDAEHYPVVVDPAWVSASTPAQLRTRHTANLVGDGSAVLIGGTNGATALAGIERFDPLRGTSSIVAALATARQNHTATVLGDGRVLVVGGDDGDGNLDTTELFDPDTNTVAAGPALAAPRSRHAAIRLHDGRVLVVGGGMDTGELFDPATDTWSAPIAAGVTFNNTAAARLQSGLVLTIGSTSLGEVAVLFDPATDTFSTTAAPDNGVPLAEHNLVPLLDGRALTAGSGACSSVGNGDNCLRAAQLFDPSGPSWASAGDTAADRNGAGATQLPSGNALFVAARDSIPTSDTFNGEIFRVGPDSFSLLPGTLASQHEYATTLVLPTGNVLVVGGPQAAAEILVGEDRLVPISLLQQRRADHTSVLMEDGRVLLAGGITNNGSALTGTVEVFDQGSSSLTSSLSTPRAGASSILLEDGRVLIAGGYVDPLETATATAELFDPTTDTFSPAGNDMADARHHAGIERLVDGRVLIVGGEQGNMGLTSATLFDPATNTFSPTVNGLSEAVREPAVLLVDDGTVLVVGESNAYRFDPITNAFSSLGPLGASYITPHLQRLASGRVLLTGGVTLQAELYDPATQTFSFTGAESVVRTRHAQVPLPGGNAMMVGGSTVGTLPQIHNLFSTYVPGLAPAGGFVDESFFAGFRQGATLLPSGGVLVTGGLPCEFLQVCDANDTALVLPPPPNAPAITQSPSNATPGRTIELTGTGFDGPQLSSTSGATSSGRPVATWQPLGREHVLFGHVDRFDATTVGLTLPATVYLGAGWLRVIVNGRPSPAVLLTLDPPANGVACTFAVDCPSGFCADGVCCDTLCDGNCEGCTAALKGSGVDGACGAVPPERFPDDLCFLTAGAPCEDVAACDSGFCVDGVCCNEACLGQCEACDVTGSVGLCVPTTGPPHGERPLCEVAPPADACAALVCDGVDRDTCAGTIGPCGVYACTYDGCLSSCQDNGDCAIGHRCDLDTNTCVAGICEGSIVTLANGTTQDCAPFVCQEDGTCKETCADVGDCVEPFACNFEGRCVTRPPNDQLSDDCGCRVVGFPQSRGRGWYLAFLGLALWFRRRRRGPAAVVLIALLLLSSQALAQPEGPPDGAPHDPPKETPPPKEVSPDAAPPQASEEDRKLEAKQRFRKGIELIKEKAWAEALAEFLASRKLYPTRVATFNAAVVYRELARYAESLETYEALMRDYPDMAEADMAEVRKAVTELRGRVGSIEIDQAEPGAQIVIDGTMRGTYPPPGYLRVSAGSHIVRLVKDGFEPFETRVDLAGGDQARVKAVMTALSESGQLKVVETSGKTVEVLVDDVVVGTTPWDGRLSVGKHSVVLKGEGKLGTAPVQAPVSSQQTTTLKLTVVPLTASLRIQPTPATASVFVDAVEVGRGTWEGRLAAGEHSIEVRSDGFYPKTQKLTLADGQEQVLEATLERADDVTIPGRFAIDASVIGLLTPTVGGDVAGSCGDACGAGLGLGAMGRLHVGYEFPIGFGLGATGGYVTASQSFDGRTTTVQPVGFDLRTGTASDALRLRGPFVGAFVSWLFDGEYPILLRLSGGPLFAQVRDQRTGTFTLADGSEYAAGPIVQEPTTTYVALFPEVRGGLRLNEYVVLTAGLEVPMWIAVELPRWDSTREVDAEVDGIGAWETESFTSRLVAFAAMSLGARVEF